MKFTKFYLIFGLVMALAVPALAQDSDYSNDPSQWASGDSESDPYTDYNDGGKKDGEKKSAENTEVSSVNLNGLDIALIGSGIYVPQISREEGQDAYTRAYGASVGYVALPQGKKAGSMAKAKIGFVDAGKGSSDFGDTVQIGVDVPHYSLTELCGKDGHGCVRIHGAGNAEYYGKQENGVMNLRLGVTPMFEGRSGNVQYGFGVPVSLGTNHNTLLAYGDHDVEVPASLNIGGLMYIRKGNFYVLGIGDYAHPLVDKGIDYTTDFTGRIQYGKPGSAYNIYAGGSYGLAQHNIESEVDGKTVGKSQRVDKIGAEMGLQLVF